MHELFKKYTDTGMYRLNIDRYVPPKDFDIGPEMPDDVPRKKKRKLTNLTIVGLSCFIIALIIFCIVIVPIIFVIIFTLLPGVPVERYYDTLAGFPVTKIPPPQKEALLVFKNDIWTTNSTEITIGEIYITGTSNQIVFRNVSNQLTINAQDTTGNWIVELPDVGQNADFLLSVGNYQINGTTTFTEVVYFTTPVPQICFDSNPNDTGICILVDDPPETLIYTIANVNTNTSFLLPDGNQTVNGIIQFTQIVRFDTGGLLFISNGTQPSVLLNFTTPVDNLTLTIPDPGSNANILLDHGPLSIHGVTTFESSVAISGTSPTIIFNDGPNALTINIASLNASRVYTLPAVTGTSEFVISETLTQQNATTFFTSVTLTGASNQLVFQPGAGMYTGITITASNPTNSIYYTIPDIGKSGTFALLQATQTFTGINTFTKTTYFTASSNQIGIQPGGSGTFYQITAANPTATTVIQIPDPGQNTNLVLSQGLQTLSASLTFTNSLKLNSPTPLVFTPGGSGNAFIINCNLASGTRFLNIPDPGGPANFMLTEGTQTITQLLTFSTYLSASSGVQFETTGGVPAVLSYEESITGVNTIFSWNVACPSTTCISPNIRVQKTGSQVSLFFDELNAPCKLASAFQTSINSMPVKWRPPSTAVGSAIQLYALPILVMSDNIFQVGLFTITSLGAINIYADLSNDNFADTGNCGWSAFTASYMTA